MKILIADKLEPQGVTGLQALGAEVLLRPELEGPALAAVVAESDCRVLIVRGTRVTKDIVEAGRHMGLIIRAGAGYNTIDLAAASSNSVFVANCPGQNAVAVAELTLGLILALDRRIPDAVRDLRARLWNKKIYSAARGLKGRTLGVIGVGRIGEAVIARALAFEMDVVAWSRSLTTARAAALGVTRLDSPAEVARCSDIVSVHLAATPQTQGLVSEAVFAELRPGAYFINTARAEVMDYAALARAVQDRGVRAALDVFEQEPSGGSAAFENPLADIDGILYGTHHIGASTEQAQIAVAEATVSIVREFMRTGQVHNCVNLSREPAPEGVLVVRHRNRPGVLAHVLGDLSRHGINVREMENVIYMGEEGACAQIRLDHRPDTELLQRIEDSNDNILSIALATPQGCDAKDCEGFG